MKDYILSEFRKAGFEISGEAAERFLRYYRLIAEWNEKFNITTITAFEDVVLKHFIDSAYGLKYVCGKKSLCDVGAGAGFPSIPLKILCPEISLTMVESAGKKAAFLNEAVKTLELDGCVCLQARAEEVARGNLRESFDVVTARAVAPLNTLCEYCLPLVGVGGIFLAYKANADEEVEKAQNAVKVLGGQLLKYEKYELAASGNLRSLVIVSKIKPADKKYPRGRGKEKTNPL
jgi:16S rRNA (guanine527-N7)-methyltransferase